MRLFAPVQVVVATLLGSPLGGIVLLALNARACERPILAAIAPALLGTAALAGLAVAFPGLRYPLAALSVAMMGLLAQRASRRHPDALDGSWGQVAGASFVGIVVLSAALLPLVFVFGP